MSIWSRIAEALKALANGEGLSAVFDRLRAPPERSVAFTIAVIEGETVIGGVHGPDLHHHGCAHCLSWIFTRFDALGDVVNVRATLLDDAAGFVPFVETCTAEALPWATTPARHSFAGFPPMDRFPELLADYAAQAG